MILTKLYIIEILTLQLTIHILIDCNPDFFVGQWWGADGNCTAPDPETGIRPTSHIGQERWLYTNLNNLLPYIQTQIFFIVLLYFAIFCRCRPYVGITENCTYITSSTTQFWEKYVLNMTTGLKEFGDIGGFKYDLPLCLLLSWIIVFLCLIKGIKSSGKACIFYHFLKHIP